MLSTSSARSGRRCSLSGISLLCWGGLADAAFGGVDLQREGGGMIGVISVAGPLASLAGLRITIVAYLRRDDSGHRSGSGGLGGESGWGGDGGCRGTVRWWARTLLAYPASSSPKPVSMGGGKLSGSTTA